MISNDFERLSRELTPQRHPPWNGPSRIRRLVNDQTALQSVQVETLRIEASDAAERILL